MKILVLHNYYQQPGGEDLVVEMERAMLTSAGHEVLVETVSNEAISGLAKKLSVLLHADFDQERVRWASDLIRSFNPDVVHVHNFFPLLTSAVHYAAAASKVAVVQTLHNYRLLCAGATFLRAGQVCELCLHGSSLNALRHRCYRKSLPGTAAVVRMQKKNVPCGALGASVDRYIALTNFARDKFIEGGLPAERILVKPNFLEGTPNDADGNSRKGVLFVGRISEEKGVQTLIDSWSIMDDIPLRVAGDGPLLAELEARAPPNVTFLGHVDRQRVEHEMLNAQLLVQPSLWYEGFPMTIVEAFSRGLPVAASNLGSLGEIVVPGRNGVHFEPGDPKDLAKVVRATLSDQRALKSMGKHAQLDFTNLYSREANLTQLEDVYADAMAARAT